MKIVLIIDWHVYYTVHLANALCRDHDVLLITRDHSYEISSSEKSGELEHFLDDCLDKRILREKLRHRQSSLKNIAEVRRVYRVIQKFAPDIVHVQENTDWRILLLARLLGLEKTVLTIHDVVIHPGEPTGILKPLRRILRRKAKKIIVHGDYLKRQLISLFNTPENKIYVVPNGTHTLYKKWDNGSVREEKATVLFFGRISQYKGIDVLIRAGSRISLEFPEAKIVIAGKGPDFEKYASLIKDRSRFELHDRFIPDREVATFFRRATVVVLPYIEASQSGVALVAFAFGKPVVATDVGSLPEVVEDGLTGFIVPPGDPEALGEAIIKILGNPALQKSMGRNALAKGDSDLSWSRIAQKTAEIYSEILSHA
jgi:starch synthase